jgi:hypothetical protein
MTVKRIRIPGVGHLGRTLAITKPPVADAGTPEQFDAPISASG